ncbi:MAG: DUF1801 domain-containing protein [Candidatus Saccharimonadales bacterium]|jgi:hypothetical protein
MTKYEPKTKATTASVEDFIDSADPKKRDDSYTLLDMMQEITGEEPKMWGPSMIGFGTYHYISKGCEADWFRVGFSPRKAAFSLYISCDAEKEFGHELQTFGKFKTGKGCIYFNKLADIDTTLLKKMIKKGYDAAVDFDSSKS